jgi:Protein of unknown function (DUF3997)
LLQILTVCSSDYVEELPGGYSFVDEGSSNAVIAKGPKFIPCEVISYDYNDHFIIAAQIQQKECFWPADSINNEVGSFNFWIIEVKQDSIFGPLTYKNFIELKNKLGVEKSLRLKIDL